MRLAMDKIISDGVLVDHKLLISILKPLYKRTEYVDAQKFNHIAVIKHTAGSSLAFLCSN